MREHHKKCATIHMGSLEGTAFSAFTQQRTLSPITVINGRNVWAGITPTFPHFPQKKLWHNDWLQFQNCREMLFHMIHYNFVARHLGVDAKIPHQLMVHFYWPGLHSDVPRMCDSQCKRQLVNASVSTKVPFLKSHDFFFFYCFGSCQTIPLWLMVGRLWSRRCQGFQGAFPILMGKSQWLCIIKENIQDDLPPSKSISVNLGPEQNTGHLWVENLPQT